MFYWCRESWLHSPQEPPTWRNLRHASFHHDQAGSHSGMQQTTGTVELPLFPPPCCLPPNRQSPIWQNSVQAGKHKWKDEDKPRASAPPSSSQAQPLDVDTFCSLRSFLPTGGRTSDWPNKHISNSVELLFDSCLLKDIICTAQTRVGPS